VAEIGCSKPSFFVLSAPNGCRLPEIHWHAYLRVTTQS
jgi:hypothetical protein